MAEGTLYGVGVGPGDPELLTLKAVRTIEACPVVAAPQTAGGAMVALDIVRREVSLDAKTVVPLRFTMGRDAAERTARHEEIARILLAHLEQGRDVAFLNLGDVSLYATFQHIAPLVRAAGHRAVAVPGVPSFCAVAAALEENLTPEMDAPLHVLPAGCEGIEEAFALPGTKVVMKAGRPLAAVKRVLRAADAFEKAALVQDCGLATERVVRRLEDADEAGYFTTLVVLP